MAPSLPPRNGLSGGPATTAVSLSFPGQYGRECRRPRGCPTGSHGLYATVIVLLFVQLAPSSLQAGGRPAAPRDSRRALQLARAAEMDRSAGRAMDAMAKYKEAVDLFPNPRLLHNLAVLYEELGQVAQAVETFQKCLELRPDQETWQAARDGIKRLRAVGRLILQIRPEGALVEIDGHARGRAPMGPSVLSVGSHRLTVGLPGYETFRSQLEIHPVSDSYVELALQPSGVERATPAPFDAAGSIEKESSRTGNRAGAGSLANWGWATLGLGLASLGAGGTLMGLGIADYDVVREAPETDGIRGRDANGNIVLTVVRAAQFRESGERKQTAGYALLGIGSAALLTSAVLFIVEYAGPSRGARPAMAVPQITPAMDGALCTMGGRF